MTFLLFLASLAVLEYLVRGTGRKAGADAKSKPAMIGGVIDPGPVATEAATSDLLALGQALNAQRNGTSTEVKTESGFTQT
jgi:hypothetical protein